MTRHFWENADPGGLVPQALWRCKRCGALHSGGKWFAPETPIDDELVLPDCDEEIIRKVLDE